VAQTIFTPFHYKTSRRLRHFFYSLTAILWVLAFVAAIVPVVPHIVYRLSPQTPIALAKTIGSTADLHKAPTLAAPNPVALPPKNPELPKENRLVIPHIGIDGVIHEGTDWENILKDGIWRVPEFAGPESGKPVILAAHRWGYVSWSNSFRKLNSFYNLPKLENGDEIQIVWNQRSYTYKVYKSQTGTEITDYEADLILYTCQLWDSPIRVFRYAKRI
jgi:hypothetical protein